MQLPALVQHVHSLIPYPYETTTHNDGTIETNVRVPLRITNNESYQFWVEFLICIHEEIFIVEIKYGKNIFWGHHIFPLELANQSIWDNFWKELNYFIQQLPQTIQKDYIKYLEINKDSIFYHAPPTKQHSPH